MSILNRPYFRDEAAAFAFLEAILWKDGTECPHCGSVGAAYRIAAQRSASGGVCGSARESGGDEAKPRSWAK